MTKGWVRWWPGGHLMPWKNGRQYGADEGTIKQSWVVPPTKGNIFLRKFTASNDGSENGMELSGAYSPCSFKMIYEIPSMFVNLYFLGLSYLTRCVWGVICDNDSTETPLIFTHVLIIFIVLSLAYLSLFEMFLYSQVILT